MDKGKGTTGRRGGSPLTQIRKPSLPGRSLRACGRPADLEGDDYAGEKKMEITKWHCIGYEHIVMRQRKS